MQQRHHPIVFAGFLPYHLKPGMIGRTIGHFRIEAKLGQGGMGEVYLADDLVLDRKVALKFLAEHLQNDEVTRRRFLREAKSAAALDHAFICNIFEIGEADDLNFIAMEYVRGQTLEERVSKGPLPLKEMLRNAKEIAQALEQAHRNSIVHRDLKPSNIMVAEGHIKVMDFGLAKKVPTDTAGGPETKSTALSAVGSVIGTPAYMSPEQLRGDPLDARSDIFSLGIVLYELVTGVHPFTRPQVLGTASAILNEEPAPISNYLDEVPVVVEEIFLRMLAKDPERRYQSVTELLLDLRTAMTQTGAEALRTDKSYWLRHAVMTLGILGGLVAGGWYFLQPDFAQPESDRSIAVLPFRPIGQDEPGLFTEGIHDDLLTRLSNVRDFLVIARGSIERFRGSGKVSAEIARELGVRWVLEGGVQQTGNQIKVNARLIDSRTNIQAWAQSYVRELTAANIFAIQGEITQRIAEALETRLTAEEERFVSNISTENLQAYSLYVQGRTYLDQREEPEMRQALDLFREASQEDPSFALAWVGVSDALYSLEDYGFTTSEASSQEALDAARRALELGPLLAEAHLSLGLVHHLQQNGPASLEALEQAILLRPSYADANSRLSWICQLLGLPRQALEAAKRARNLDPLALEPIANLTLTYLINGEPQRALELVKRGTDLQKVWPTTRFYEGVVLYHLQRYVESIEVVSGLSIPWAGSGPLTTVALGHAALGNTDQTAEYLELLRTENAHPFLIGLVHASLEDYEAAFTAFESIEGWTTDADFAILSARYLYPQVLDQIRPDPRFQSMLREISRAWGLNGEEHRRDARYNGLESPSRSSDN